MNCVPLESVEYNCSANKNQFSNTFWICWLIEWLTEHWSCSLFGKTPWNEISFVDSGRLSAERVKYVSVHRCESNMPSLSLAKGQWWIQPIYLKIDIRIKRRANKHLSVNWFLNVMLIIGHKQLCYAQIFIAIVLFCFHFILSLLTTMA